MVEKITKSLSVTVPPHILRSRDTRAILTTLFAAWLPLSKAVLVSVIEHLPAPPIAQASRLPALIDASPGAEYVAPAVRNAMVYFKTSTSDPVVAYVSKMVSIPASELPENKRKGGSILSAEEAREMAKKKRAEIAKAQVAIDDRISDDLNSITEAVGSTSINDVDKDDKPEEAQQEDPEHLIGFARLFSGTLSVGDFVYVLPPKFSPANPRLSPEPQRVTVTALYLLMGRGLEVLTSVPAGVIFGIAGLEGHILKSGTLCSQLEGGVNLAGVSMGGQPIVRVALEPLHPSDLGKMIAGMRLLEQSDPCARYEVMESGEHVILTAGELHLERCLKDLRERFARCEIQAGEPIVPYRETIVSAAEMAPPRDKSLPRGTVVGVTTSKQITVRLRVRPLPASVTEFLDKSAGIIGQLYSERKGEDGSSPAIGPEPEENVDCGSAGDATIVNSEVVSLKKFKSKLSSTFAEAQEQSGIWASVVENIAAFGPRRVGPNIFIDATDKGMCKRL